MGKGKISKKSNKKQSAGVKADKKSRHIQKIRAQQQNSASLDPEQTKSLFEMIFIDGDQRKLERGLMTLSSISLSPTAPNLLKYYDPLLIQRLLKIVNQLENRTSYFALDSLR